MNKTFSSFFSIIRVLRLHEVKLFLYSFFHSVVLLPCCAKKFDEQNVKDYEGIIEAAGGTVKAKQLAAQLIPKFFKYFPTLAVQALDHHFNLCEDEELGVSSYLLM